MGRKVKTDVGVMKRETRQLDAGSKRDTGHSKHHTCDWTVKEKKIEQRGKGGEGSEENVRQTVYCIKVHDTVDNWIIKANLTEASAPPPAERRCQRSVTSSIYVH